MVNYLSFEKPLSVIEGKIRELNELNLQNDKGKSYVEEINKLEVKAQETLESLYKDLNTWEKTQVARHPERPHFLDYSNGLVRDFVQLSGDRVFGEDSAIIGGIGKLENISVMLIGHEKGYDTETRIKHNFGMAHPEGYRKSIRLMNLANKFNLPILTFVDTAGAYPGVGAEQRGQSEAIASSIKTCLSVDVPLISIIIGEGGSGGAVAIATGDRVLMLENSVYSVISPEGCASILWQKDGFDEIAANSLKLTSSDLVKLNVIDEVIAEPLGGAHRDIDKTIENVKQSLIKNLKELNSSKRVSLISSRRKKYLKYGSTLRD